MRHFQEELDELQQKLLEMAGLVEAAIHKSIRALEDRSEKHAEEVLRNEARINLLEIEVDDFAVGLLALHQPMAGDLRFLTAAIKINSDLERMGDLAVNIVERALSLIRQPEIKPLIDIPRMAGLVESMVRKSLDAFVRRDAGLAHSVLLSDDAVDELRNVIYRELIAFIERDAAVVSRALDLIFIARNLERIADHATNIAEDVLFLVQGVDVRHHKTKGAPSPQGAPS
jgi:phosphate transport system protein